MTAWQSGPIQFRATLRTITRPIVKPVFSIIPEAKGVTDGVGNDLAHFLTMFIR